MVAHHGVAPNSDAENIGQRVQAIFHPLPPMLKGLNSEAPPNQGHTSNAGFVVAANQFPSRDEATSRSRPRANHFAGVAGALIESLRS